jgi:hypothetical protein
MILGRSIKVSTGDHVLSVYFSKDHFSWFSIVKFLALGSKH